MKRHVLLIVIFMLAALASNAAAVTGQERDERYFACFNFSGLVTGGTVNPHWLDEGSFWWVDGGDTLAVTAAGEMVQFSAEASPEAETTQEPSQPGDEGITEELASPQGNRALIIAGNLWLENAEGTRVQVTDNANDDRGWSLWGAKWSSDGAYLAAHQFDSTGAPTIPIVDWLDPMAPVSEEVTSQACEPRGTMRMHMVRADGSGLVAVAQDPDGILMPEPLWHVAGWVQNSGEFLAIRFNRIMNRQDLFAIDPASGSSRLVISETSKTFVDGLAASFMLDWYYTPRDDGQHFIWLSQRSGYHHLYLYKYDGTLVRQLTGGDFPVLNIVGVDEKRRWIYFMAKPDVADPTSQHLCRVDFSGNHFKQLTESPGRRRVHLSPDFSVFVENHSDLDRPPSSVLRRTGGEFVCDLAQADDSQLKAMDWTAPERFTAKAADGVSDCFCALYLPPDFDAKKSYPVIEVIYAGPQWMIVPRRMPAGEYGDTAAALAQLGYVTVIIDSPGTAGVGRHYQDAVFGKLGMIEIPDHVAAMKNLAESRPWMDLTRVGVHGKSWGGYFVLRAMLMAPEFYKVGVASSAVADLATTGESPVVPYIGLPADNPAAYEAADCLIMADRLQGKLLLTIGTADRNTPFGQTMRMLAAFQEADRDVDLMVFPGQHHWLQGASMRCWQRSLRDHFLENLPTQAVGGK